MKDLVIKAIRIKRELFVLLGCFIAAELINLGAIIAYHRPMNELILMIGYVLLFTILLYLTLALVRVVIWVIVKTLKRK